MSRYLMCQHATAGALCNKRSEIWTVANLTMSCYVMFVVEDGEWGGHGRENNCGLSSALVLKGWWTVRGTARPVRRQREMHRYHCRRSHWRGIVIALELHTAAIFIYFYAMIRQKKCILVSTYFDTSIPSIHRPLKKLKEMNWYWYGLMNAVSMR